MSLTEPQVGVLAALVQLKPTETLTIRQLSGHAGRQDAATRAAVQALAASGLALGSSRLPTEWRITPRGRSLLQQAPYRE
ncbi:hypothetical protein [Nocardia sp. NPDC050710]|uniref:hypothetical protein n=1 Tax=Nocardia sp. NPDC050710 TaxID=3157220 RepID=UPI0033F4648A